jgi:hypothetical protein
MEIEHSVNYVLKSIIRQRLALTAIRRELPLSRTDIEVLAFAKQVEVFTVYKLINFYPVINVQQLRTSISRLQRHGLVELLKAGIKNKPAIYCISYTGENILNSFLLRLI